MKATEKTATRAARAGFTLIELLLVIAIIGILATVVAPNLIGSTDDARIASARSSISGIETAAQAYRLKTGRWPASVQELQQSVNGAPPVLDPKKNSKDPWGNDFQLHEADGTIEIRSAGPDGSLNTQDDITNRDSSK